MKLGGEPEEQMIRCCKTNNCEYESGLTSWKEDGFILGIAHFISPDAAHYADEIG